MQVYTCIFTTLYAGVTIKAETCWLIFLHIITSAVLSCWKTLSFLKIATTTISSLFVKSTIISTFWGNFPWFVCSAHNFPPNNSLCIFLSDMQKLFGEKSKKMLQLFRLC